MRAVDHTHPDTDEAFGDGVVYVRGPAIAADGGEREADSEHADADRAEPERAEPESDDGDRMCDVDHVAAGGEDVNRVHERGGERDEHEER